MGFGRYSLMILSVAPIQGQYAYEAIYSLMMLFSLVSLLISRVSCELSDSSKRLLSRMTLVA